MVSAVKWEAAPSSSALITTGASPGNASLANDTLSAAGTEYANQTSLNTYAIFEFQGTWSGGAPSDAEPTVDIFWRVKLDGTNSVDAPVTGGAQQGPLYLTSIPVRKITSAQRLRSEIVLLPPVAGTIYLDNQSGATLAASWAVTIYTANLEGQ